MPIIDYSTHQKPSHFMKIEEGVSRIRVLTKGVICYEHGSRMGGKYIPQGVCSESVECEFCKKGIDPKVRYKWVILDLITNQVKVLATGTRLGEKICAAGEEAKTVSFEIQINKKGSGTNSFFKVELVKESSPVSMKFVSSVKQACDYLSMRYLKI